MSPATLRIVVDYSRGQYLSRSNSREGTFSWSWSRGKKTLSSGSNWSIACSSRSKDAIRTKSVSKSKSNII